MVNLRLETFDRWRFDLHALEVGKAAEKITGFRHSNFCYLSSSRNVSECMPLFDFRGDTGRFCSPKAVPCGRPSDNRVDSLLIGTRLNLDWAQEAPYIAQQ